MVKKQEDCASAPTCGAVVPCFDGCEYWEACCCMRMQARCMLLLLSLLQSTWCVRQMWPCSHTPAHSTGMPPWSWHSRL